MIRRPRPAQEPEARVAAPYAAECEAAAELLGALMSPQRLAMVALLVDGPRRRQELDDLLGIPRALANYHLTVLRAAGLVQAVQRDREVVYSLTHARVASMVARAIACANRIP
jgi:DNA-binding transcriptional ArsR family regulator